MRMTVFSDERFDKVDVVSAQDANVPCRASGCSSCAVQWTGPREKILREVRADRLDLFQGKFAEG